MNSACGKRRLRSIADKHGIPEDEIRAMSRFDPTETDKFLDWIAGQVASGEVSFPSDGSEMKSVLDGFRRKSGLIGQPDINGWAFSRLREKLAATESKGEAARVRIKRGQQVIRDDPPWMVIEITTPEAASKLCRPEWCIKDAKHWDTYGCGPVAPAYLIMRDGKKYACIVPHSGEMKDVNNCVLKPTGEFIDLFRRLVPHMAVAWTSDFTFFEHIARPPEEIEESRQHAHDVIKARWPDGPASFANDPEYAYYYAQSVIKARWHAGESAIASHPTWAYEYARYVVRGRWTPGEAAIASSPDLAFWYAKDTVNGRWPLGEPAIASNPVWAYWYAHTVIKARWPEGEAAIARMPAWHREQYAALSGCPCRAGKGARPQIGHPE